MSDMNDMPRMIATLKKATVPYTSEADVIEKLIVPVLRYVFEDDAEGRRLEFFRASRDGRSKRRNWDLGFRYENECSFLGVVECKNLGQKLKVCRYNIDNSGKIWPRDKGGLIDGCENAKEYVKKSLDSKGDVLYQVWFYVHKKISDISPCKLFSQPRKGGCVLLSNGAEWCIFKDSFFADENNPAKVQVDSDGVIKETEHMKMFNLDCDGSDFHHELSMLRDELSCYKHVAEDLSSDQKRGCLGCDQ